MAELEKTNKKLETLKSSFSNCEPYKLPDNYFNDLNRRIIESTENEIHEKPIQRPTLWIQLRPIVYMAAMFVSLFLIIKFVIGDNGSKQNKMDYADSSTSEMEVLQDYMASTVDDYSVYESYEEHNDERIPVYETSMYE